MGSLKAFLPVLAGLVGTTPDALYTRQRALVELGLLTYKHGRGPGSGSPLSADNVAALLIAIMTADTLQETDKRVKEMCLSAPRGKRATCAWTDQRTLQKAVARAFEMEMSAPFSFLGLSVYRGKGARLAYRLPGGADEILATSFDLSGKAKPSRIFIDAWIDAPFFRQLSAALHAEISNEN